MIEAFLALRHIHSVFAEADRLLEETIGKATCIPHCGVCCEHNVAQCMTIEAIHAISVLAGTGGKDKIVAIAEGWLLDREQLTIYDGMPIGWSSPKLRDEWLTVSRSQCPFLSQDKRCLIHDVRPLACRAFGVTRDGADLCPRPLGKGETEASRVYIKDSHGLFRKLVSDFRESCNEKNKTWIISGCVPAMIYRCAEPEKFKNLIDSGRIASAKVIGIDIDTNLMWQPQVDMLRAGVSPDLVVARS